MTKSPYPLQAGWKWCDLCNTAYLAVYGGCPVHEMEKPVTLTRREARVLYDLAVKHDYSEAPDFDTQKSILRAFLAELAEGNVALAQMVMTPDGIGWQVIEPAGGAS